MLSVIARVRHDDVERIEVFFKILIRTSEEVLNRHPRPVRDAVSRLNADVNRSIWALKARSRVSAENETIPEIRDALVIRQCIGLDSPVTLGTTSVGFFFSVFRPSIEAPTPLLARRNFFSIFQLSLDQPESSDHRSADLSAGWAAFVFCFPQMVDLARQIPPVAFQPLHANAFPKRQRSERGVSRANFAASTKCRIPVNPAFIRKGL